MTTVLDVLDTIAERTGSPPESLGSLRERTVVRRHRRQRRTGIVASLAVLAVGVGALTIGADRRSNQTGAVDEVENSAAAEVPADPVEPSSPPTSDPSDESPVIVVPPAIGPEDQRDPIQRFLEVPVDADEASRWSQVSHAQAVTECMRERGYEYREPVGESIAIDEALGSDPAFFEDLDGGDGCRAIATLQTNLFPDAEDEYALLEQSIGADTRSQVATAALDDCLARHESETALVVPAECEDVRATWDAIHIDLTEEYAPAWIMQHLDLLEALRDRIAGLVERAAL